MRSLLRWSLVSVAALLALLVMVLASGAVWLRASLPQTDGNLQLEGLRAPVEVRRDAHGVPTITAENDHDAYFALGFVHAQDRLWQMDFMRRTGAGRLSEVAGAATLPIDRFMRVVGIYAVAEANYRHLSAPARAAVDAYTAGVNAFLEGRDGPLPLEFQLLFYEPEPWRPADSIVWGRIMALRLSGNWSEEALRARLARHLDTETIAELWPPYPSDGPVTLAEGLAAAPAPKNRAVAAPPPVPLPPELEAPLRALTRLLPWRLEPKSASNAWVLAGSRTASGRPLLANDPHLALNAPGIWYLARVETPDWQMAGATAPGVPFLVAGHNGHVAWGLTTTDSDTQDLFVEKLLPPSETGATRYQTPDGPKELETRNETIRVRWAEDQTLLVRHSRHGPLLSDVLTGTEAYLESDTALALAWPALDPEDRTATALFEMNRARDAAAFKRAALKFDSPHQNIVYADRAGRIGFLAPARVPIRRQGDGLYPVPGWTGEYDWTGFIAPEDLPAGEMPASGHYVSANNKIVPDSYPYLLSSDWSDHHRARRILQMLDANGRSDIAASAEMQLDSLSLGARDLLPLLLAAPPASERAAQARELLQGRNGRMTAGAPEPLIYYAWQYALNRVLMADELGEDFREFQRADGYRLLTLLRDHPEWCDDVASPQQEDCSGQIAHALEQALALLAERFGEDPDEWAWGAAHRATFDHPLLDRIPLFDRLFDFGLETPGGSDTVNRGGPRFRANVSRLFENVHGSGYRAIYDLADLDNSRFMIATGQSGNPLSRHYGGLAVPWRDGNYLELVGSGAAQGDRLLLTPHQGG